MKTTTTLLLAGVLGTLAAARPADAQEPTGRFTVATRGGYIDFGRNTSLQGAPYIGLDTEYGLKRFFTLGTSIVVSRPNTVPGDFLTTQTYGVGTSGDTTFVYGASQAVSLVNGELLATLRYPMSRFTPFVSGGFGMYGMFMDPQTNNGERRSNGTSATVGGGLAVRLSERAGIQLDVRNMTLFGFDRRDLDPTGGRNPYTTLFAEDFSAPPNRSKSVNNLMFTLGFRYVPGGDVEDGARDPNLPREDRR
jgi:hypothetical protein